MTLAQLLGQDYQVHPEVCQPVRMLVLPELVQIGPSSMGPNWRAKDATGPWAYTQFWDVDQSVFPTPLSCLTFWAWYNRASYEASVLYRSVEWEESCQLGPHNWSRSENCWYPPSLPRPLHIAKPVWRLADGFGTISPGTHSPGTHSFWRLQHFNTLREAYLYQLHEIRDMHHSSLQQYQLEMLARCQWTRTSWSAIRTLDRILAGEA